MNTSAIKGDVPRVAPAARAADAAAMPLLDGIARVSAWLGGASLLATALLVGLQIVARLTGVQVPSADDFTAWTMAGSVFLALPYTLRQGAHIRVTLLLHALPAAPRRVCEIAANLAALVLVGWGAWHCARFVYDSYLHNEVSQGIVVLPMWVPQLSMPLGMGGLFIMLLGRLASVLRGTPWAEEDHG